MTTEAACRVLSYTKTDTLLLLRNISLKIGDRQILRDVNAEIKDIVRPDCVNGQVVCFLGPSGVGKSTLSRIIAGIQQPTSGAAFVATDQRSTSGVVPLRPAEPGLVGMVPQNYPLFEFATVHENLMIAGTQAALDHVAAVARAARLIETLCLREYRDLYPAQLSGGTRQRVAIARQLMCAGHYLVLDEPFSGLDPILKRKAADLITQVADLDERNTVIIVTHDIEVGMSVADTVWLMGYEKDASGAWLPGARLVEQYDLAAEGLCWRPDLATDPRFLACVAQVKQRFTTLMP